MDVPPLTKEQSERERLSAALHGPILGLLSQHPEGVSIHQLVSLLKQEGQDGLETDVSSNLAVFRINFLVMHALFWLQDKLAEEGVGLEISSLMVRMYDSNQEPTDQALDCAANGRLRDYYLDWNHLEETSEEDVEAMLEAFWNRYWCHEKADEAFAVLGLEAGADEQQIRQAFRRLANLHHPDKGGDTAEFLKVREAYEDLMARQRFEA